MIPEEARAAVDAVVAAYEHGDPGAARLRLHPYLHWISADGTTTRGRTNVLAMLTARSLAGEPLAAPDAVELRDAQLYRWRST